MKIYVTSAYSSHKGLDTLRRYVAFDSVGHHQICENPVDADAILFVENTQFNDMFFKQLLEHPLLSQHPDKVFMYNEMDRPWDLLPGLYCCMTRQNLNDHRHRAFAYLSTPNPYIEKIHESYAERQWLYSFMGSMSHSCRRPIMRLKQTDGYVQDTSDFNVWQSDSREMQIRGRAYADLIAASQFVLCPRGIGTSSLRLYETLEAGRVPVIISDHWVPPGSTDWGFAIQVEERRVASIPGLLKAMAGEALERGEAARQAWEHNYAPDKMFNTLCDTLESLVQTNSNDHRAKPAAPLHKWLATGEQLTRSAAQRLRGH